MEGYWCDDGDRAAQVATFRRFTRYYLLKLQPLRDAMKGPSMHAAYMRVLRTLGEDSEGVTASWIAGHLRMDRAYVRRILAWYRALGYLSEFPDLNDGRRKVIRLSPAGRAAYVRREQHAAGVADFMLALIHPVERRRMISAMRDIERILRRVRWDDIRARSD